MAGSFGLWLPVLLVGAACFLLVLAIMEWLLRSQDPIRRRLGRIHNTERLGRASRFPWLERMGRWVTPRDREAVLRIRERLFHAGFRSRDAMSAFFTVRYALALGLPLFMLLIGLFVPGGLRAVFVPAVLLLGIGYVGPSFWLDRRIKRRQVAIRHALPDALDLLVVCTEAGLGLDAGLQRVTRDMDVSHPEMMDELTIVIAEIRAGVDRMEALRNLGKRTGLDDIQALVMTLAQSMRFGTSIAESLRYYSEELRTKRMQAAREQAAKLTVKMALPLGVCFMPGFLIITAGAAILSLVVAMKSMG
ncbi:type II secretion system F family protein [Methylolobus aquaticus]